MCGLVTFWIGGVCGCFEPLIGQSLEIMGYNMSQKRQRKQMRPSGKGGAGVASIGPIWPLFYNRPSSVQEIDQWKVVKVKETGLISSWQQQLKI